MAMMPGSFLDDLRTRTDMIALVRAKVPLARSGREWKGRCPFHNEQTPSFYAYDDHFHCFGCGEHGDAITFVMKTDNLDFREAVEKLAAAAGIDVPKSEELRAQEVERSGMYALLDKAAVRFASILWSKAGERALAYLHSRGLHDDTIRAFGLGYVPSGSPFPLYGMSPEEAVVVGLAMPDAPKPLFQHRIMFPIRDKQGRIVGFSGRALSDSQQPKYLNGPETPIFTKRSVLYGHDRARKAVSGGNTLVVVEGQMDVLACHQVGFTGAVATLGSALTEWHLAALWAMHHQPTLCFDGDAAGRNAAHRALMLAVPMLAPSRTLKVMELFGEDPASMITLKGAEAFAQALGSAKPCHVALYDMLQSEAVRDTPEGRAAFLGLMGETAARIADKHTAIEYVRAFRDRYYGERRAFNAKHRYVTAPPPTPVVGEHADTLAAIDRQIADAQGDFEADPTPAVQTRLTRLVEIRNGMMQGEA